jgi:hypothetical protein
MVEHRSSPGINDCLQQEGKYPVLRSTIHASVELLSMATRKTGLAVRRAVVRQTGEFLRLAMSTLDMH